MRKLQLLIVLLTSLIGISQNKQLLYNFNAIPQSLLTNPGADVSYKFYAGVPLISGISASVSSSGFSAYDLFGDNGIDFNVKLREAVFLSNRKDKVAINEQIELFSGGLKIKGEDQNNSYVSFGMYQEFDFLSFMPKDLAVLVLDGNERYLGKVFDLADLNVKAEMLTALHLGFHKNINKKLTVGFRGKMYSSVFNATSTRNSGYVYTIPSGSNIYEQVILANLQLNTSGFAKYDDEDFNGDLGKDIKSKALFGGNIGLGFDTGLTYYPKKNIQFTASVVDVGFIKHSKEVENLTYKGFYRYDGINPKFTGTNSVGNIYKEFNDAIPVDTLQVNYTTWRPAKFNTSIQFSFEEERSANCNCSNYKQETIYKSEVGAQLFMMTTPRTPLLAFTTFYSRKIFSALQMKATYTVDSYSFKNFGLGLSSHFGPVNFYVLADNLLEYRDISKAKSLSVQLGLNFIFKDKEASN